MSRTVDREVYDNCVRRFREQRALVPARDEMIVEFNRQTNLGEAA